MYNSRDHSCQDIAFRRHEINLLDHSDFTKKQALQITLTEKATYCKVKKDRPLSFMTGKNRPLWT